MLRRAHQWQGKQWHMPELRDGVLRGKGRGEFFEKVEVRPQEKAEELDAAFAEAPTADAMFDIIQDVVTDAAEGIYMTNHAHSARDPVHEEPIAVDHWVEVPPLQPTDDATLWGGRHDDLSLPARSPQSSVEWKLLLVLHSLSFAVSHLASSLTTTGGYGTTCATTKGSRPP